ncbi:hypothetical protein, variant [Salpingoeca rosetta]|nr:hypothetical protein, variant [Salpingoeca rosetta]EGD77098.1 hypothetical protein, variant [Salpingoeca rosetta]|eukprot:XP_004990937.1 hypothetical protein, variant [Salpingoeca rosetta]
MGIEKLYYMQSTPPRLQNPESKLYYACRSQPEEYELVARHVQLLSEVVGHHFDITLITIPQRDALCESILEENGVHGLVTVAALPLYFLQIDNDLFSMDAPVPSRQLCIHNDTAILPQVACGLRHLSQHMRASWSRVVCAGHAAADVYTLMREFDKQDRRQAHSGDNGDNGDNTSPYTLLLFDRRVDMVTPLCSQLTYAGMLSETVPVTCGTCEVPTPPASSSAGDASSEKDAPRKLQLSAEQDHVYAKLRDVNFSNVAPILKSFSKQMTKSFDERNTNDLTQLASFVKRLPALQGQSRSLAAHVDMSVHINRIKSTDVVTEMLEAELSLVMGHGKQLAIEFIQELICRQFNVNAVLRLLLLLRITNVVSDKAWAGLKQMTLHAYGYKFLPAFSAMESVTDSSAVNAHVLTQLRKRLSLAVSEDDAPDQVLFGMHPLSSRFMATLASAQHDSDLADLQLWFGADTPFAVHTDLPSAADASQKPSNDVVVCFLGGTTHAELTSMRSRLKAGDFNPIFLTTDVLTGDGLMKGLYSQFT